VVAGSNSSSAERNSEQGSSINILHLSCLEAKMSESEIKSAIERKVGSSGYSIWTIGITDNPSERREAHKNAGENIAYWSEWKADSETVARNVEKYFLGKKMKGGSGGGKNPTYVYVF